MLKQTDQTTARMYATNVHVPGLGGWLSITPLAGGVEGGDFFLILFFFFTNGKQS